MSNQPASNKPQPLSAALARQLKTLRETSKRNSNSWPTLPHFSRKLSSEARVRCLQCHGTRDGGRCEMCAGKGLVCPKCRGMRFVRTGMVGWVTQIERCGACLNPDDEMKAIMAYLHNWVEHHPFDESDEAQP